jgi:hypothetical protein
VLSPVDISRGFVNLTMRFDSTEVVVYGMRMPSREIAGTVRKVLIISVIGALVVIALTVLNFTVLRDRTTITQSVLSCVVGISIPVIGWIGAKTTNRSIVGIFCSFSLSCGLFNLISYVILMASAGWIDKYLDQCLPNGTVIINGTVDKTICQDYTHDSIRNVYIIASCVSLPVIILQCLGGYYGNSLYASLTPEMVLEYGVQPYAGPQPYIQPTVAVVGSPVVTVPYQGPVTVVASPSGRKGGNVYPNV